MVEKLYREAVVDAIDEEMARDSSIFVVGEGIGPRGGNFATTVGLYEKYGPMRLRDTPITERGFVGMCCGAAMSGARPIVDFMFVDFILDAMGELINQIAKIIAITITTAAIIISRMGSGVTSCSVSITFSVLAFVLLVESVSPET